MLYKVKKTLKYGACIAAVVSIGHAAPADADVEQYNLERRDSYKEFKKLPLNHRMFVGEPTKPGESTQNMMRFVRKLERSNSWVGLLMSEDSNDSMEVKSAKKKAGKLWEECQRLSRTLHDQYDSDNEDKMPQDQKIPLSEGILKMHNLNKECYQILKSVGIDTAIDPSR